MADLQVKVTRRENTGKNESRRLRRTGRIPAVLYGEGKEAISISVDGRVVDRILHSEKGENTIFQLAMEGTDLSRPAMVKEIQIDPVTDELVHADFIRISADTQLHVNVHVELVGVAVGVKVEGGRLDFQQREVTVACLPKDIPAKLTAQVADLHVGQSLRAGDIELPEGVELETDPALVLATVHARVAEEEAAVPEGEEGVEEPAVEGAESKEEPKADES